MKSKKAFMLGAAIAASCFVSACALAEQSPAHLTPQPLQQAVQQALKSGGNVTAQKASAAFLDKIKTSQQLKKPVQAAKALSGVVVAEPVQADSAKVDAQAVAAQAFTPLCQTLGINQMYNLDGVQTGNDVCYHFNVPQKARATVMLVGQSAATNMSLTLFQDDGQNNITSLGTSDNPGNANEVLAGVLPPGDYYWFMHVNSADGSPFSFGVDINMTIDDFEPNDSFETAYQLPDTLNYVTGNSDTATDEDYFSFKALRGQKVSAYFDGVNESDRGQWISEYFDGVKWTPISPKAKITWPTPSVNGVVNVRVRPNPAATWKATARYKLSLGSTPEVLSHSVQGDNVVRIPASANDYDPFMTTQAARDLSWAVTWADSTGKRLQGLTPYLQLDKHVNRNTYLPVYIPYYGSVTGVSGAASGTVNLGNCAGEATVRYVSYDSGYKNTWETNYNFAVWRLRIEEYPDVGVGGDATPVSMAHICSQRVISSER
ncbi:hypothetical protein [Pseudomonas sp. I8001]|uniref:hypothetical protein n=1 Tax=Pseudomonas sp. I8001 TaxID=2738825 RepID=UPI0015A43AFA|nr:hypothetical protein [Pseudomonas sp. I8001]NWB67320.1 hypothetical protein [Pseudomonas sp. I8001]